MGSSGGGGGGGDTTTTTRYADYIEIQHKALLKASGTKRDLLLDASPFNGYSDIEISDAFFGTGNIISDYDGLYEKFGSLLADFDIDTSWSDIYNDTTGGTVVKNLVTAEAEELDDDIEANVLPRFTVGQRDIGSVMSSSFITGKALIEERRVKSINRFSADLKYRMISVAASRWKTALSWKELQINVYQNIMKLYYTVNSDVDDRNYQMAIKDTLWPFTVLGLDAGNIAAMQGGAVNTSGTGGVAGGSQIQKSLAMGLSGAAAGAMIGAEIGAVGGPWGAAGGAALGLASSFL